MFDSVKEPEDIFAATDPVQPSGAAAVAKPPAPPTYVVKTGPSPWLFIGIAAVVFGAIGGGGYYWWSNRTGKGPDTAKNQANVNQSAVPASNVSGGTETEGGTGDTGTGGEPTQPTTPAAAETPTTPADTGNTGNGAAAPTNPPETAAPLDSDNDGLSDEEEARLGTNPQSADTDNDGLSDFDEVRIYQTDPTKPDTDGDGFLDGQEVKGGYNPKGPGKLFTVPN